MAQVVVIREDVAKQFSCYGQSLKSKPGGRQAKTNGAHLRLGGCGRAGAEAPGGSRVGFLSLDASMAGKPVVRSAPKLCGALMLLTCGRAGMWP